MLATRRSFLGHARAALVLLHMQEVAEGYTRKEETAKQLLPQRFDGELDSLSDETATDSFSEDQTADSLRDETRRNDNAFTQSFAQLKRLTTKEQGQAAAVTVDADVSFEEDGEGERMVDVAVDENGEVVFPESEFTDVSVVEDADAELESSAAETSSASAKNSNLARNEKRTSSGSGISSTTSREQPNAGDGGTVPSTDPNAPVDDPSSSASLSCCEDDITANQDTAGRGGSAELPTLREASAPGGILNATATPTPGPTTTPPPATTEAPTTGTTTTTEEVTVSTTTTEAPTTSTTTTTEEATTSTATTEAPTTSSTTTTSSTEEVAKVEEDEDHSHSDSEGTAGGASATVPSTPRPRLTDDDRKAAIHWAENLAASTTIETMATKMENLIEKFTVPEEYQHLCTKSFSQNKMKQICGASACDKPQVKPDADYVYDPVCLENFLRVGFKRQILAQGLGKANSPCVPVPTEDEWDHFPDFALPDFVKGKKSKSKKGLLQYLEKADGTGAGPWRTWGDMRNQLCGPSDGAFDCVPLGEHSPNPGTGEGYDWEPLEKEYRCYEHEFGYDPHGGNFKGAALHWTKNLAASTTIETMAAKMENLVEAFTLPEQYQHACKENVWSLSMELICGGPSACEKPKGKPDADYKYDAACLEKWLRMELRDQILSQGLGKTHSRCVPVPTRDDWDHFPDFALPDFVKGKKSKSKKGLLQYLEKADGTGAGPWRTWGDMRNQLCGPSDGAFDCVPLGEHSPNPGTGEGYDWEPLEKEHRCYHHELDYDPQGDKLR
eukprot:g2641.t1